MPRTLCLHHVMCYSRGGTLGPPGSYPALLAFGDSILDTGNNNLLKTLSKCNYPPYGRDFPGGILTGGFGNGKVFSDLIAEHLGIKAIQPAFLDPNLEDDDLVTGVCFASGGSGLDQQTANLQNVLSIAAQFNLFKQYVRKLEASVGMEKAQGTVFQSLYLVSSGNNDIAITYFSILRSDINAYTIQLVQSASAFVQEMYGLGARKFAFLTTLPLGCLSAARITTGGLNNNLSGANIELLDVYNPLLELIQNPNKYGFIDSTHGCCASGTFKCDYMDPLTCPDTSTHVFWDVAHPSEKAYRTIISQLLG
ncbi:hypothetical protein V6N13_139132 [Hibiscus sabdariffa]|uniref:GDSL esterase/lipase n=1 Tax=Hibiscus sabdariffa TaxID=183260 RepID=A0ABR2PKS9_9ROSI